MKKQIQNEKMKKQIQNEKTNTKNPTWFLFYFYFI